MKKEIIEVSKYKIVRDSCALLHLTNAGKADSFIGHAIAKCKKQYHKCPSQHGNRRTNLQKRSLYIRR